MSWPGAFREQLRSASTIQIRWALEIVPIQFTGGVIKEAWIAATDPALSSPGVLLPESIQVGPVGVSLQTWQHQAGAFSLTVQISSYTDITFARRALRRGALCRLLFAIEGGASLADYQPLRVGRIQQVTSEDLTRLKIEVWDILSALRTRPTPALDADSLPQTRLFNRIGGTNFATSGGSHGAGANTYTLNGDPTGIFNFEDGDPGLFAVEGNSGTWFYKTFTGATASPDQLTGCSTAAAFGTAEAAASGNGVRATAYLTGHPAVIAGKLLTSTGTASANGVWDQYPASWGFAIDGRWLDRPEFLKVANAMAVATGTYSWDVIVEEPVEDGLLWLSALLAEAGIWLTTRQGQIVPRCAQSPWVPLFTETLEITDADIVGQPTVEWYDASCPDAYNTVTITTSSGTAESSLSCTTLPCREEVIYDLSAMVRSNETAMRNEALARLRYWGHYPAEIVSLTVISLGWGLCPGDLIPLTTTRVRGRFYSTREGYSRHLCMVVEVQEMVQEGAVKLKLAALPLDEQDDIS